MPHESNPQVGIAARDLRSLEDRELAGDYVRRLEARIASLERALSGMVAIPRGVRLRTAGGEDTYVPFSPEGWLELWSSDDTISVENNRPATGYMVDLTVAAGTPCTKSYANVQTQSGDVDAEGCGHYLKLQGSDTSTYVRVRTTGSDDASSDQSGNPDTVSMQIRGDFTANDMTASGYVKIRDTNGTGEIWLLATDTDPDATP